MNRTCQRDVSVPAKNLKQMFFWPGVLGLLTLLGLVMALLKDNLLEDISLISLSLQILVIVYIYFIRR